MIVFQFSTPVRSVRPLLRRFASILLTLLLTGVAVESRAQTAKDHYEAGMAAKRAKNFPLAVQEFEQAVAADPSDAMAHSALGWSYLAVHNKPRAIQELRISAVLQPGTPRGEADAAAADRVEASLRDSQHARPQAGATQSSTPNQAAPETSGRDSASPDGSVVQPADWVRLGFVVLLAAAALDLYGFLAFTLLGALAGFALHQAAGWPWMLGMLAGLKVAYILPFLKMLLSNPRAAGFALLLIGVPCLLLSRYVGGSPWMLAGADSAFLLFLLPAALVRTLARCNVIELPPAGVPASAKS
jgi:tetratricopeptide (TPR) repeat protein